MWVIQRCHNVFYLSRFSSAEERAVGKACLANQWLRFSPWHCTWFPEHWLEWSLSTEPEINSDHSCVTLKIKKKKKIYLYYDCSFFGPYPVVLWDYSHHSAWGSMLCGTKFRPPTVQSMHSDPLSHFWPWYIITLKVQVVDTQSKHDGGGGVT